MLNEMLTVGLEVLECLSVNACVCVCEESFDSVDGFSQRLAQSEWNVNAELKLGQMNAKGVLVSFSSVFQLAKLYEDFFFFFFFRAGSFAERRAVLPKQGWGDEEWDLLTTQFAFALAHTSCEAHFMILGEFMYLSWLRRRRRMWAQRTPCILFWTYN